MVKVDLKNLEKEEILSVYQYVCYTSNCEIDSQRLNELYKQGSTSETWI